MVPIGLYCYFNCIWHLLTSFLFRDCVPLCLCLFVFVVYRYCICLTYLILFVFFIRAVFSAVFSLTVLPGLLFVLIDFILVLLSMANKDSFIHSFNVFFSMLRMSSTLLNEHGMIWYGAAGEMFVTICGEWADDCFGLCLTRIDPRLTIHRKRFSHFRSQWPWCLTFWPHICSPIVILLSSAMLRRSFYGFPVPRKSEAQNGRTDGRTDGRGATLNAPPPPREGRLILVIFAVETESVGTWYVT